MITKLIHIFVLLLLGTSIAMGSTYQLRRFSTAEGLPNSMTRRVVQDNQGFVWIATCYGLYRYDGYEVKPFKTDIQRPGFLPSNDVVSIAADSRQRLWIGTQEGISCLSLKTNRMKRYDVAGVAKKRVNQVFVSRKGEIYAATIRGLVRYDERLDTMLLMTSKDYHGDAPGKINTQDICEDSNGDLLIATWEKGLYRYSPCKKSFVHYPEVGGSSQIVALFTDSQGSVWAGTYGAGAMLLHFSADKRQLRAERFGHPLVSNYVYAFCENRVDNSVWIGTRSGVTVYHRKDNTSESFPTNEVRSIFRDRDEQMWICTKGDGILLCNSSGKDFSLCEDGDVKGLVSSVLVEPNGAMWTGMDYGVRYAGRGHVATIVPDRRVYDISWSPSTHRVYISTHDAGLMECKDGKVLRQYLPENSSFVASRVVRAVCEDRRGNLWVATSGGLGVKYADGREGCMKNHFVKPKDQRKFTYFGLARNGRIYSNHFVKPKDQRKFTYFGLARNGRIYSNHFVKPKDQRKFTYFGLARNRLCRLPKARNGRSYSNVGRMPVALSHEIVSMATAADGSLWLATATDGVVRLMGDLENPNKLRCKLYNKENGLMPVNTSMCVKTDRRGRVWVGTEGGGLCVYDKQGDRFVSVHQYYNLPGDMACSIEEDMYGNLWVGTNKGLARMTIHGDSQQQVRIFTSADGLSDNFFEQGASFSKGNKVYFGSGKGLVIFETKKVVPQRNAHQVAITDIVMNGAVADEIVASWADTLLVPYAVKDFTIRFSALDYVAPSQCAYAYRLKGFDNTWRYTASDMRNATYTQLAPGTYTFEVKAADVEGNWGDVRSLTVIVEPPLWRTWWAYTLYIIVCLALLSEVVRRIRQRMLLRNKLMLQMNDGGFQVVVNHEEEATSQNDEKKQLAFEIKNLNYTDADEMFLRNAILWVNDHLSDTDFDISQFASEMGVSRTTLFKKLKNMTGLSATAFVRDIRLKAAAQALDDNPGIRISDLAYKVGFNDPKYFSVCFKKAYGLSPSEYIER